jgi:translation initiation factor IF-2
MSSEVTVKQLATTVGIPVERLLAQLNEAGIARARPRRPSPSRRKLQLLGYLRRSHGKKTRTMPAPNAPPARPVPRAPSRGGMRPNGAPRRRRNARPGRP